MSTSSLTVATPRTAVFSWVCDYVELTKPRIAVLELVVVLAAGLVASWGQPEPLPLLAALVGTLLVAASASAANQLLEHRQDAKMARTAARPLPGGRLSSLEAGVFAGISLAAGGLCFLLAGNVAGLTWALLTWVLYVAIYTPLKLLSPQNTLVGAVAGALPVLIGWTASGAAIDGRALSLVSILFLWQFPHFMAIAWLYRRDYAAAGYQMLPVVEPTGQLAGWQATMAALLLLPVSILPLLGTSGLGSLLYVAFAGLMGAGQLALAIHFWKRRTDASARLLLTASLVYLPTLLVLLILATWI